MRVALFIPCYIDQFYPSVGIATLNLLEGLGVDVVYPRGQTCCGQPMANAGFESFSAGCDRLFIRNFSTYDYIVAPSGSCVLHIREHLHDQRDGGHNQKDGDHDQGDGGAAGHIRQSIFELTEFLTDVLNVQELKARFPYRVALHQGCHGQRGLKLSQMSELVAPDFSKPLRLLRLVEGIRMVEPQRRDECCGFGGTFCVTEEAVSVKMGKDRIADYTNHGAEVITSTDMSCLMHLEGILRRQGSPVRVRHIAEILTHQ